VQNLTASLLIFGYGNPSRGDDALGPLLLERLQELDLPHLEMLTDFQLQVEHALDLQDRERVLFIDASVSCSIPYAFSRLHAQKDASYTSHVMSPMALLHSYIQLYGDPPPTYLLQVRGECFELGKSLSASAIANLEASFNLLQRICSKSVLPEWEQLALLQ
jgi:hydrogenase maturation protease